jgi:hypothetical protein
MDSRPVNEAAEFLPQRNENELPAVRIGDALIFMYWTEDGDLRVTVDTEDADAQIPVRIMVNSATVWEGDALPGGGVVDAD